MKNGFFGVGYAMCAIGILGSFSVVLADTATTTVTITVCGDGLVSGAENCDQGSAFNNGQYGTSTANRQCYPGCMLGYAPYCGDAILQPIHGEQCDDGNEIVGDYCSLTCTIENIPQGSPGGGGGFSGGSYSASVETKVILQGKAYPNSQVHLLKDGEAIGIVQADPKADFYFSISNITPGTATFGFWAEDEDGLKSISLTTTLTVVSGAVTTVTGAYIPPTINLDKRKLNRGETLTISGRTAPSVTVSAHVNSEEEVVQTGLSDNGGRWTIPFDTAPLANEEFHTAKALFQATSSGQAIKSSFSQSVTFYVGKSGDVNRLLADLNGDGKVNLIDFSILLFHWGTTGPIGDLNNDKKVNLADFSILLFYWTG